MSNFVKNDQNDQKWSILINFVNFDNFYQKWQLYIGKTTYTRVPQNVKIWHFLIKIDQKVTKSSNFDIFMKNLSFEIDLPTLVDDSVD